jgi:hypothetical protein
MNIVFLQTQKQNTLMENISINQHIALFIHMLQSFANICQNKLNHFASHSPSEYECGKSSFQQGEISLEEISKHQSDDYMVVFHLFQTQKMIQEIISSLQLKSRNSVIPHVWWSYSLGYWYGTGTPLVNHVYSAHPDAFVSLYPMPYIHDMVKRFFEKRLVDVQEHPGRHYIFYDNLIALFANRIWWMCFKEHLYTLDCNAVYYYVGEKLECCER